MTPLAKQVLTAAGYLSSTGEPAAGLVLSPAHARKSEHSTTRLDILFSASAGLEADAVFRGAAAPLIVFKSANDEVAPDEWHRVAWNAGVAPLLWVTTPQWVRLYNAYQPPPEFSRQPPLLREFRLGPDLTEALKVVRAECNRLHASMQSFWSTGWARAIDRRQRVDNVLLTELGALLATLVRKGLGVPLAQKLVGRCIFFQYLAHRGYLAPREMEAAFGGPTLDRILADLDATYRLFAWIRATFNGDLFPIEDEQSERRQIGTDADRLRPLADFFGHWRIADGQGRLFPFRFDVIPVELISSIYEKFVHMSATDGAPTLGVHYTPMNLVDLLLDRVFEGLRPDARVLDLACGSGVFLVESLRRLMWLKARSGTPVTRALVRDTLFEQIRGVDISPAALSVAAFSLYLALLELDPEPPRTISALERLRFKPLLRRVLFATSAFDDDLVVALVHDSGGPSHFDVIVGNPPWTYSPVEKRADRQLARVPAPADVASGGNVRTTAAPSARSGATYARLRGHPVPPRSTDWPFLWRARDFCHEQTRVAVIMKATPFFSLTTSDVRDALLRAFPQVTLVNLSQLRGMRLFQDYDSVDATEHEAAKTRKATGPALLFYSNCLPTTPGALTAFNLPWNPDFERTGVFELSAEPPAPLSLDTVTSHPAVLKAAMFGTERDAWFIGRLQHNPRLVRLADWCRELGLPMGQGWRAGSREPAGHLLQSRLPIVEAKNLHRARITGARARFGHERVDRKRTPEIFAGPLVLLPEGALTNAPERGRYTAAFDTRGLAYKASFVGVSFKRHETLAPAFAALMHSGLVAYEAALIGGTTGVKQTKIETRDLESLVIPRLEDLTPLGLAALSDAQQVLALGSDMHSLRRALDDIDRIVADAAGLDEADRQLLSDVERRAAAVFFETRTDRERMLERPTPQEIDAYARGLCTVFNALATDAEDLVLEPDRQAFIERSLLVIAFRLTERARVRTDGALRAADIAELGDEWQRLLGGPELLYLKAAQSLRIYAGRSVYIVKPARYRYFSPAAGQSDADRIIADLMSTPADASPATVVA